MLYEIFKSINNLGCPEIANIVFAVLLDTALDAPKKHQFLWASNTDGDFAVISDGLQKAYIPTLAMKPKYASAFMGMSRSTNQLQIDRQTYFYKWVEADKTIKEIWKKLLLAYPNALEIANKYLDVTYVGYSPHPDGVNGSNFDSVFDIDSIALRCKNELRERCLNQKKIPVKS